MIKKLLLTTVTVGGMLCVTFLGAMAKDCYYLTVDGMDDDSSTPVTLSGTVTKDHAKLPKGSELRASNFLYLKLDKQILIKNYGSEKCYLYPEITIFQDLKKMAKWNHKHVAISGTLIRHASALAYPGVSIEVTSITPVR